MDQQELVNRFFNEIRAVYERAYLSGLRCGVRALVYDEKGVATSALLIGSDTIASTVRGG